MCLNNTWPDTLPALPPPKDLAKDAVPHYKKAKKFFDGLAVELVQHGHALDVFICSLEQVGGGCCAGCGCTHRASLTDRCWAACIVLAKAALQLDCVAAHGLGGLQR